MKNITSVLILLFISISLQAQSPIEKNVGDFTTVKVFDLIKISLIKSTENKVMITGENPDNVEVINKNGKLKIRMKFDNIFNGNKTFVAVHYTKIDVIDGNEGARIVGAELIEQDFIELRAQEGAILNIGLDVKMIKIKAVSGGIIETHGRANTQDIGLNSGGIYQGRDFDTKNTTVKVRAGGEAEVKARDVVDARITAGGDIYIYGNPKTVKKKQTFGGRIKRFDNK